MIKSAVIGCGAVSECHLQAIKQYNNVELVAVCDIKAERAKEKADKYGCRYYTDYKELYETEKPDCVHLCLPHYLHVPVAVYFLNKNVNVFLEKPLAISLEEGEELIKTAQKSEANIGICFQNRYNPSVKRLKEIIDKKGLGTVIGTKAEVTWNRTKEYYTESGWRGKMTTEGGGVLINQSIHMLDLMQWLFGDISVIKGHAFTDRDGNYIDVEDTACINLTFANGINGIFYATTDYCENSSVFLEIIGTNGTARILGSSLDVLYSDGTSERIIDDTVNPIKHYWGTSHPEIIADFYNNIKEKPFWISPEEALKTLRIIKEVQKQSGYIK